MGGIELSRMFRDAHIVVVELSFNTSVARVPAGKHWMILYGKIEHTTGADTIIWIMRGKGNKAGIAGYVQSGAATSRNYPLNTMYGNVSNVQVNGPMFMDDKMYLEYEGTMCADCISKVTVLEW